MKRKNIEIILLIALLILVVALLIIVPLFKMFVIPKDNDRNKTIISESTELTEQSNSNNSNDEDSDSNKTENKVQITVIDFSAMSKKEIENWCNKNNIKFKYASDYSDTIKKNDFIKQSIKANNFIYEGDTITITYSLGKKPTFEEQNALNKAISYLNVSSFSYKSLIEQLKFEGFSAKSATYAVDNCGANWNEQAAKKAESYMNISSFSKSGLIEQLKFDGFTKEQAEFGAKSVGY